MPVEIVERSTTLTGSATTNGMNAIQETVSFSGTVQNAAVALQGFFATYGAGQAQEVLNGRAEITDVAHTANRVTYTVQFAFDQPAANYECFGRVAAAIIAEI